MMNLKDREQEFMNCRHKLLDLKLNQQPKLRIINTIS
jgi:hypothetical protein